jgi:serine/threonine protein kinase
MAHTLDLTLLGPASFLSLAVALTIVGWFWARQAGAGRVVALTVAEPLQHVGPYRLANKLGAGAMGEVYRAWHPALGGWRAVKILPRNATARERERFEKEARFGAVLRHPNTVSIYERGEARDGTCYYAMELLEGLNLEQLVERDGPQPPERVVNILLQLCAALEETHDKGLVHRDIKPENVLLTGPDLEVAKLIDFGLVEQLGAVAQGQPEGALIGTPLYISPEAIVAPETVGTRSDLYGLGAVAYFLLRGKPVFHGRSVVEVCSHHLHTAPEPLSAALGATIPAELERIVLECLAKDPSERPASASELARRLARCLEQEVVDDVVIDTEGFEPELVASHVGAPIEISDVVASQELGCPVQDTSTMPGCLSFLHAQRMLERLDAYLCNGKPSHDCCIAA